MRGQVKVRSYTRPPQNLAAYRAWELHRGEQWQRVEVLDLQPHRGLWLARISACDDRQAAARLVGAEVAIAYEALPAPPPGEFYWRDLIGLAVVTAGGEPLGVVSGLIETGAHDVLVVAAERERLIPFVRGVYVLDVDLARGVIEVDWHPED